MTIRDEAARLLDEGSCDSDKLRLVLMALLEELSGQDEIIDELRKANTSFGTTFDQLAPAVADSIVRARRDAVLDYAAALNPGVPPAAAPAQLAEGSAA